MEKYQQVGNNWRNPFGKRTTWYQPYDLVSTNNACLSTLDQTAKPKIPTLTIETKQVLLESQRLLHVDKYLS